MNLGHRRRQWNWSRKFTVTRDFPKEEIYGLVSQMRRAAVSIPSNISEGAARGGDREFIQFLIIARGSLSEFETQLLISNDLGYMRDVSDIKERIDRLFSLISGLLRRLRAYP